METKKKDKQSENPVGGYEQPELVRVVIRKSEILEDQLASSGGFPSLCSVCGGVAKLLPIWWGHFLKYGPAGLAPTLFRSAVAMNLRATDNLLAARAKGQEKNIGFFWDLGTLLTLCSVAWANNRGQIRVLDFGGAAGAHYLVATAFFREKIRIHWNVVETPAMAQAAGKLAKQGLKFYPDLSDAARSLSPLDLVLASGSIHVCEDPIGKLDSLISLGAKHLILTRTCFLETQETLCFDQTSRLSENGPGPLPSEFKDREVSYPNYLVPKQHAVNRLGLNYRPILDLIEGTNVFPKFQSPVHQYGFWGLRRRQDDAHSFKKK